MVTQIKVRSTALSQLQQNSIPSEVSIVHMMEEFWLYLVYFISHKSQAIKGNLRNLLNICDLSFSINSERFLFISSKMLDRVYMCPFPAGIYLFQVNNRNRTLCEICSKLTIKTPEPRHWCRSGDFIVNFEQILQIVLVFLLLTLNRFHKLFWRFYCWLWTSKCAPGFCWYEFESDSFT